MRPYNDVVLAHHPVCLEAVDAPGVVWLRCLVVAPGRVAVPAIVDGTVHCSQCGNELGRAGQRRMLVWDRDPPLGVGPLEQQRWGARSALLWFL